jgi:DNA-binding NtrC family response regulator
MKHRILVVDDERSLREFLTILLEGEGYTVTTAENVSEAVQALRASSFQLCICDLKLPDGTGLDVLQRARELTVDTPFIIITAYTTPEHALEALRAGAVEYLSKPFDVEDLKVILRKVLTAPAAPSEHSTFPEFIGSSPSVQRILEMVPRIARAPSTALITGESGTGKELLARAIHHHSPRAEAPFLTVNCGALPEGLLESELFGHVRGAFTGAVRDHAGMIVEADHGSLFLDEVGELTLPMQVKLLRVLQEQKVRPVGGTRETSINVRFIAATNRDLQQHVRSGAFREDLYYRLNVIQVSLPPLRRRREDISELARHFVRTLCKRFGIPEKRLTPDALRVFQAYRWPGNVRELENTIERIVALEPSEIISSGSLPERFRGEVASSEGLEPISLPDEGLDLEEYLNGIRRSLLRQALQKTDGNQRQAARLLRLSYRAFRYHAEKLGLREDDGSS